MNALSRSVVATCGVALSLAGCGIASAGIVSSGSVTIPGTWTFDFDAGAIGDNLNAPNDIFWEMMTAATRAVKPTGTATITAIGIVDFAPIGYDELAALTYGGAWLDGSDGSSILVPGYVFAVHTDLNNYAKVKVMREFDNAQNHGLVIEWVTYSIPGPSSLALAGAGLLVACVRRRR
jgi:uncharacterized protein (TIGR03382 family)